jgi:hypothetical protein
MSQREEANASVSAETEPSTSPAEEPTPESEADQPDAAMDPLETPAPQTPFLDDAKVEKRPLGAFADESQELSDGSGGDTPATESPAPAEAMTPSLPPELDSHLVALEEQREVPEEDEPATEPAPAAAEPAAAPLMNQSIPQQYTAQATAHGMDSDVQPHPVFDTHDYHQPLLPAENKPKRGKAGLIILIFAIMLVLGAGLGYLAFTYGLFS